MIAADIIAKLGLSRHPEGGWYRETWRAETAPGERASATMIYFLLDAGEASHWHKVDASEFWLWHAGAPLELRIAADETGPSTVYRLGPNILDAETPQVLVPPNQWQAARSLDGWTLVSCAVSPGFVFEGFTLAPPEFDIPSGAKHP